MAFYSIKFGVTFRGEDLGVIDADEVTMDQALTLENTTGFTLQEMVTQLGRGSANGMQAALWFRLFQLGRAHELKTNFTFKDFDVLKVEEESDQKSDPTEGDDPVAEAEKVLAKSRTSTSRS